MKVEGDGWYYKLVKEMGLKEECGVVNGNVGCLMNGCELMEGVGGGCC